MTSTEQTPQWTPPKNWRWMPGMCVRGISGTLGDRIIDTGYGSIGYCGKYLDEMSFEDFNKYAVPDFSDPATLGCLLALVREAWKNRYAIVTRDHTGWLLELYDEAGWKHRWPLGDTYPTEEEALLAALEAAP